LKSQKFTATLPGQVFALAGRPAEAFAFTAMEPRYDDEGKWVGAAAERKLAGRIERFYAATSQKRWSWRTPPEFSHQSSPYGQEAHRIVNAVMTGDQQRVLFANYDDLGILDLATGKARAISGEQLGDCNLGPECAVGKGNRALYRDGYRQIALVDHETGREVWRTQLDYPETTRRWRSRSLSISRCPVSAADGKIYLASFSSAEFLDPKTEEETCEIVALDAATGRVLNRFLWQQATKALWWPDAPPLAVSPDGSRLALVSPRSVQVMSTRSGEVLAEVTPENVWLSSAAISPDGQLVAAGGVEGEFWMWKLEPRRDSK
jgi:outer membrane protein assembly factor BamB